MEAWQQGQAQELGIEVVQWRDPALERPTDEGRGISDAEKRRHFDLIFGPDVLNAQTSDLHRHVVDITRYFSRQGLDERGHDQSLIAMISDTSF